MIRRLRNFPGTPRRNLMKETEDMHYHEIAERLVVPSARDVATILCAQKTAEPIEGCLMKTFEEK